MTSLGLRHLALIVTDAQASKAFYTGVMGMHVEWEPDPHTIYLTTGGQDNLALHQGERPASPRDGGLDHFGFFVDSPQDVAEWYETVKAAGRPVIQEIKHHRDGAVSFYFQDPDGYVIQILYHVPVAERAMPHPVKPSFSH